MNRTLRTVFATAVSFLLLVSCPNPLMDAVKAKVAQDEGHTITGFGFTMAGNAKLYRDIAGVVNETTHAITLSVPKWVPLTGLVATFDFLGATVTVNGAVQTSGVTANDFSSPLTYTVTPTVGTPASYTVTATSSAQGLRGGSIQGVALSLSGTVDTVAGQASIFGDPAGCVQVGSYAYVADYAYHVIWQIRTTSPYTTTIFAGTPCVSGSDDGVGTSAKFFNPQGLTTDGTNLYVADFSNGMIRKIVIGTADVSTLVSGLDGPTGVFYYSGGPLLYETDAGSGTVRELDMAGNIVWSLQNQPTGNEWPVDIVRHTDKLYVADQGLNSIWQIDAATHSAVSIFAGNNEIDGNWNNGTGINAYFFYPSAFALSGNDLYVADYGNNEIRKVTLPGASVTTYAGSHLQAGTRDGLIPSAMLLYGPQGVSFVSSTMIIAESGNKIVRKIQSSSGSTIAGTPPGSANGVGSSARFYLPRNLSTDGSSVWIVDGFNHVLRSLEPDLHAVGTLAGVVQANNPTLDETDGSAETALFLYPSGITQVGSTVFVCDNVAQTIRKLDLVTGQVTTFAGTLYSTGDTDTIGALASFNGPSSITNDGTYLYVTDFSNHTIRRIEIATADVTTIAGTTGLIGNADGIGASARFRFPFGITTDGMSLFVTDRSNHRIRKIDITSAAVSTLAGSSAGYVNGTGSAARFRFPRGITTDGTYLYVADGANHVIRRIDIATAVVDTVAGPAPDLMDPFYVIAGEVDGTGTAARFNSPYGITTDGTSLFVSDAQGHTIRRIR